MAQIKVKHSTSAGSTPSGLTSGELAVNITDKKLFVGSVAGTVELVSQNIVTSFNGVTGGVGLAGGAGITLSVSGSTASIGLNYLYGATAIPTTKYPEKGYWFVVQDPQGPTYAMRRATLANISYLFLGTQGTKGSGNFFRMATDIDGGEGTVTDEYVSFSAIADELVGTIDGGTFA